METITVSKQEFESIDALISEALKKVESFEATVAKLQLLNAQLIGNFGEVEKANKGLMCFVVERDAFQRAEIQRLKQSLADARAQNRVLCCAD